MYNLISCEYNMDTGCVELWFLDGCRITIDCTAVENAYADNMYERSELDYLIYNDPEAYAELILAGDPETYLKIVAENKLLDESPLAHSDHKELPEWVVFCIHSRSFQMTLRMVLYTVYTLADGDKCDEQNLGTRRA